jgi:REP element-mobilizing transposase RayT
MTKFRDKYRIESNRWEYWDYKNSGAYFITICTKHRQHFFGTIEHGKMTLTEIGSIAKAEWQKTPKIRKDMNITLGEFVVMPDHMHGIIIIGNNEFNTKGLNPTPGRDAMHRASTGGDIEPDPQKRFGPQRKNLASIMRGFKSSVTIQARKINPEFSWQPNYYDRVIRNKREYMYISDYILDNVRRWELDI